VQNKPIKTIFVCEFITGGGLNHQALSQSLLKQGESMRDALLHDLSELSYQIITAVDVRLAQPRDCHLCSVISAEDDVWLRWAEIMNSVDAVWLIAPETDGNLAKLTALALQHNKIILGCGLNAINVCSSKLSTYQLLKNSGINTVETYSHLQWPKTKGISWLAKPDDGAGCEQTVCFDDAEDLSQWLSPPQYQETHVIQPYLVGVAGSVSCVMYKGKAHVLSCNQQLIAIENNVLQYQGCVVNGMRQHWKKFVILASQIAQLLPDLAGYVGIDVIVNDNEQEEAITLIEINPRLTTSYIGLREATGCNTAELIMSIFANPDYQWPSIQQNEVLLEVAHA
jgi:predicted ATP-grasp superfamily ATP-dependent carboligase